jgi:hypothetical protein
LNFLPAFDDEDGPEDIYEMSAVDFLSEWGSAGQ